jgi:DNA polymerase-3 subunit gamma/tau
MKHWAKASTASIKKSKFKGVFMVQSLYRAYRPLTFSQMVGQDAIVRTLRNQVASGRIGHAYLFCGTRGTGKTSAARIMAMAANCPNPDHGNPCLECINCQTILKEASLDVFEMDAASNSRVEEIREMLDRVNYPPQNQKYKVYIIDEVHMLSNAAFNALLKTLEEPPEYMIFILATTESQKLPATILSRCQRFDFRRITSEEIAEHLKLALVDGLTADEEALELIAVNAEGSMRDAWSLMDSALGDQKRLDVNQVRDALGAVNAEFLFDYLSALIHCDAALAIQKCDELMAAGKDMLAFLRDVSRSIRNLIAALLGAKVAGQDEKQLKQLAQKTNLQHLSYLLDLSLRTEQQARLAQSPRAVLDLFSLRACLQKKENDGLQLSARIAKIEEALKRGKVPPTPKEEIIMETITLKDEPGKEKVMVDSASSTEETIKETPSPANESLIEETPPAKEAGSNQKTGEQVSILPLSDNSKQVSKEAKVDSKTKKPEHEEAWNKFLKLLAQQEPSLHSLINQGRYDGYRKETFFLRLEVGNDFICNMLNSDDKRQTIEKALSNLMGKPVGFRAHCSLPPDEKEMRKRRIEDDISLLSNLVGRENIIVQNMPE